MIQFFIGAAIMALGISIAVAVRSPEDKDLSRSHATSPKHILLSNLVLVLIMTGGALMALALL